MSRVFLVTGATGKQGGSVVDALLDLHKQKKLPSDISILAVTRNTEGGSAQKLLAKSSLVKLVQGDLDHVPAIFDTASKVAGQPVWGVFSVQVSMGPGASVESEKRQGKALVDESLKRGVKFFVYSSVDRGGEQASWDSPTNVPHFMSKHEVEQHLKTEAASGKNTSSMSWTILRPTAFMENVDSSFQNRAMLASIKNVMGSKRLQWVATRDIGTFAALAFSQPEEYNGRAISLAGDELNVDDIAEITKKVTGQAFTPTYWIVGSLLNFAVKELSLMLQWFMTDGYGVDIAALRKKYPTVTDFETWVKRDSKLVSN